MATVHPAPRPMSPEERKVIFASSLGTVFEWYDFYLYGSLAAIIAKQERLAAAPETRAIGEERRDVVEIELRDQREHAR